MSSRGDIFELEAVKVSLDLLKATGALSLAFVAALGTYMKAAGLVIAPTQFLFTLIPCGLGAFTSIFGLLISVRILREGENPSDKTLFQVLLWASPLLFVGGCLAGLWVLIG